MSIIRCMACLSSIRMPLNGSKIRTPNSHFICKDIICPANLLKVNGPKLLFRYMVTNRLLGTYAVASEKRLSFSKFLSLLRRYHAKRAYIYIPVPWKIAAMVLRVAQCAVPIKLKADQLLSLSKIPYLPTCDDLKKLRVKPQPIEICIAGRNRIGLEEAYHMLQYVGVKKPMISILKRYLFMIQEEEFIIMPNIFCRLLPCLSSVYDRPKMLFRQRASIAFYICETTPKQNMILSKQTSLLRKTYYLSIATTAMLLTKTIGKICRCQPRVIDVYT